MSPGYAIVVCRMPDGSLIWFEVMDSLVKDTKQNCRDDSMPVIAVVRPKMRGHSAPDVIRHM